MIDHPGQSTPDFASARAALRREKLAARLALPTQQHQHASQCIRDSLLAWLLPRPVGTIAFCAPLRGEVDCTPLILRLIESGWRAAMPVVVAPATPLQFRPWTADTQLIVGLHGIAVPASTACIIPDTILLPLVAFDAAGYRLGYGGGYFDRTLAALQPRPLAIGVGFDMAEVATIHPGAYDVALDAIVTESRLRIIGAR